LGEEVEYKPIPVKDILTNMKNLSELMVSLAYYSILYGDRELTKEVFKLEGEVDELQLLLTMQASLATRSVSDAEKMVSVYKIAEATNRISDAAADIAAIALSKIKIPPSVALTVFDVQEAVSKVKVAKGEALDLKSIMERLGIVFDVLAVRRDKKWFFQPSKSFRVERGDVLLVKGSLEAIKKLREHFGLAPLKPEVEEVPAKYRDLAEKIIQLKRTSEFMVDLAYTALLTRSEDVAKYVADTEEWVDRLVEQFEYEVVGDERLSDSERIGFLKIATSSENIADAANDLALLILKGLEPHPIIDYVIEESEERISVIEMDETDEGKTLSELGYTKRGIIVLAVRRGEEWFIMPSYSSFRVKNGDLLLVRYLAESEEFVEELEKEEDREEIIEEIQEEEWEE